jgi:hypothetical protein
VIELAVQIVLVSLPRPQSVYPIVGALSFAACLARGNPLVIFFHGIELIDLTGSCLFEIVGILLSILWPI